MGMNRYVPLTEAGTKGVPRVYGDEPSNAGIDEPLA